MFFFWCSRCTVVSSYVQLCRPKSSTFIKFWRQILVFQWCVQSIGKLSSLGYTTLIDWLSSYRQIDTRYKINILSLSLFRSPDRKKSLHIYEVGKITFLNHFVLNFHNFHTISSERARPNQGSWIWYFCENNFFIKTISLHIIGQWFLNWGNLPSEGKL